MLCINRPDACLVDCSSSMCFKLLHTPMFNCRPQKLALDSSPRPLNFGFIPATSSRSHRPGSAIPVDQLSVVVGCYTRYVSTRTLCMQDVALTSEGCSRRLLLITVGLCLLLGGIFSGLGSLVLHLLIFLGLRDVLQRTVSIPYSRPQSCK
jgi:hypothetical protein